MTRSDSDIKPGVDSPNPCIYVLVESFFLSSTTSTNPGSFRLDLVSLVESKRYRSEHYIKALQCHVFLGIDFCYLLLWKNDTCTTELRPIGERSQTGSKNCTLLLRRRHFVEHHAHRRYRSGSACMLQTECVLDQLVVETVITAGSLFLRENRDVLILSEHDPDASVVSFKQIKKPVNHDRVAFSDTRRDSTPFQLTCQSKFLSGLRKHVSHMCQTCALNQNTAVEVREIFTLFQRLVAINN